MAERPVLFSGPMVRAILDRRKTQTRRCVSKRNSVTSIQWECLDFASDRVYADRGPHVFCPVGHMEYLHVPHRADDSCGHDPTTVHRVYPRTEPGDVLYVKEAWRSPPGWDHEPPRNLRTYEPILYLADAGGYVDGWGRYRHARFMPRALSRLDLPVTEVRVERVQSITGRDVLAEGVDNGSSNPTMGRRWENQQRMAFEALWDSINGKRPGCSWAADPWLFVYGFEPVDA